MLKHPRRNIVFSLIGAAGYILVGDNSSFISNLSQMAPKTFRGKGHQQNFTLRQDKVDYKKNYIHGWPDHIATHPDTLPIFYNLIAPLKLPKGMIVELGVYRGKTFDLFCSHYGKDRCLGLDIIEYTKRDNIIIEDVRNLKELPINSPIALGWSDTSTWHESPSSRLAGLNLIVNNLANGGYIIEAGLSAIPSNVSFHGFEVVHDNGLVSLLKKVSSNSYISVLS